MQPIPGIDIRKISRRAVFWAAAFMLATISPGQAQRLNPTGSEVRAFLKADANRDRVLTRREFRRFVRAMAASGQSTARLIRFFSGYDYAFAIADKNGDGIVTPMEMRRADQGFRRGK
ncbi:MAG: hypothetical protein C0605_12860 [Hyphomicrobiales bacterium]|nr:MAG: hypothetical protein C0605_12860 [Hyphomicrobiales bacterium]